MVLLLRRREHVGIIDFAYVQGHEIWNKVADVVDRVVA
jgi:hypothetical protein